jgi:hypothetical protein
MKVTCLLFLTMSWATLTLAMCENSTLSPLGERVARDSVLISRRGTGLRPPEGYGRSESAARYGPQAGEGVPTRIGLAQPSRLSRRLAGGEGVASPAFSPADTPHRPVQGGAGWTFARRRVMDAQGAEPATARLPSARLREARRQVRGRSASVSQSANRPKQFPNNRQRYTPGNPVNVHQPGSNKSGGAAKSGFIGNGTGKNAFAVRAPSLVRPTAPPFNNVRHRSPNPAVVSGSASSQRNNTEAINGTRMNRKP